MWGYGQCMDNIRSIINELTKRRARVIYSQVPAKLKKLKLKRLQKRSFKINKFSRL